MGGNLRGRQARCPQGQPPAGEAEGTPGLGWGVGTAGDPAGPRPNLSRASPASISMSVQITQGEA
jgi:hypothetical protein